jgi:4-amino-4-deoxy-L-arabinose transferase-like glycosyltransferase
MSASSPLPATAQQQAADAGTRVTSGPPAGITWTVVAVLAASDAVFGSMRAALAISAALTVVALALLAGELWSDRRVVLAATVVLVFSPFFMSQSGTFLSYQFSLLLFLLSGWLLVRGLRTRGKWTLVAAGAAIGAALFGR